MALDGQNAQEDHIVRALRMVLRVFVGTLTTQKEVGTCLYLLHRLIGPQFLQIYALYYQVIDAINEDFSSFALQLATSHGICL